MISDRAEILKWTPQAMPPTAHIIDWFHISMKSRVEFHVVFTPIFISRGHIKTVEKPYGTLLDADWSWFAVNRKMGSRNVELNNAGSQFWKIILPTIQESINHIG